jgi:hypothetical protein
VNSLLNDPLLGGLNTTTATNTTGTASQQQRKVVAARNTVYGVPFLDQSSRQGGAALPLGGGGNMHSLVPISDYEHLAKVCSRQSNHMRPTL